MGQGKIRLKKITLFGFKSFADRTTLEFHPGITAIVGPNGCGKSNISDAFRWVLGEQSAKSLRGHKMQDVIFAGANNRRPMNISEVTVTLTDVQGALPIEFDEVSITRRLHRSGESEYLLNGTEVRLKDIQALFFDSGIGKEAFSIFEQGKIDQVIHYTPMERRTIFEEAAGIVRFLHRKREALRKLEQTDLNLTRIEDVLREVQQRIHVLEKQAERALQYKEQKALYEELEKRLLLTKWRTGKQKLLQHGQSEAAFVRRIEELSAELKELKEQLHQARIALHENEQAWKQRSAEMYEKRGERDLFVRDRSHLSQRREELQQQILRWEQELQALNKKGDQNSEEYELQAEAHGEMRAALTELKATLEESQQNFEARAQELEEVRQGLEEQQALRLRKVQAQSAKSAEWKQVQARAEALQERMEPLEEKLAELLAQKEEAAAKQKSRSDELKKLSDEIDTVKGKLETLDENLAEWKQELQEKQARQEILVKEGVSLQARLKILQELKEAMEGFSSACKKLLEESSNPKSPLYLKLRPLYEVLLPPAGLEKAASITLQPYAQTLVVATYEDRRLVLEYAKSHKLADFSLFCAEDSASAISEHFLIGLKEARDLKEALQYSGPSWFESSLLDARKVLFFEPKGEGNAFMREAEISSLQESADSVEQQKVLNADELHKLQQRISETQFQRSALDKEMRSLEMKLVEVNYTLLRHQADVKRSEEESSALRAEKIKTAETIEELFRHSDKLKSETAALEKELKQLETSSHERQSYLEELGLQVKKLQSAFESNRRQWQEAYAKERQQLHALEMLALKKQEAGQRIQKLLQEVAQAKENLEVLHESSAGKGCDLEKVQQQLEKLEAACTALEKSVEEAKQRRGQLEESIQKKESELKAQETEKNKLALQLSQLTTLQEALAQAFQEKYQEELCEVRHAHVALIDDLPATEKQLRHLKSELDNTQDVNMMAIEECAQDKQRSSFLGSQVGDLKSSRQELANIIAELDTQSKKLFKETFDAIRANFQKNFAILFNGGEADLHFVEGEDVLEAGIEISAKPPGKQMRSISLLSGGEKCLTAMALLFAIFEVKPAPYCILDEIDAPLDDTNVERFLNVVKQFIDRCQFIIITHNKRTMAIADRLFGVSMQERGVSKLLAMEFSQEAVEVTLQA